MIKKFAAILILVLLYAGCKVVHPIGDHQLIHLGKKEVKLQTENVFILVLDGPRWSETFGDPSFKNVPNQGKKLIPEGVFFNNFSNEGATYTISGHTAITTGYYEKMNNSGYDIPSHPSIFQYFLKQKGLKKSKACILASKGKLNVIGHTSDKEWERTFYPYVYAGTNGSGLGYPSDANMWPDFMEIIKKNQPKLTLINLLDADAWAHQGNWDRYIKGIQDGDQFALKLWKFIQSDPNYKDKTTLFITNDHGRHLDGVKDGFISHGDNCSGCKHIQLIALGPDFEQGLKVDAPYELVDLTTTVAAMLGIEMPTEGKVIQALFQ